MENAAKALTIAAGVLIGIIIISIAVYLFTTFGKTSSEIYSKVEQTQIDKFNSQFLKYQGSTTCTAHDIVSIANLAKNNNEYYELKNGSGLNYYVNVEVGDCEESKYNNKNFEGSNEEKYTTFIDEYSINNNNKLRIFYCNVEVSKATGRVWKVTFTENRTE